VTERPFPLVRLRRARKAWIAGSKRIDILKGIDLDIFEGTSLAIMGPSGAGKSTLLHILGLLTPLDDGELQFDGRLVSRSADGWDAGLRTQIGFVFQDAKLIPELTVLENVRLPLVHRGFWPAAQKRHALEALVRVNLEDRVDHYPKQLSGGELMRTAIARAIVQHPRLLLADEPTGNLDSVNGALVTRMLLSMVTPGRALVYVTHNREIAEFADHIVIIKDGQFESNS
jgi:putative ABC transport system ATP-binding protein